MASFARTIASDLQCKLAYGREAPLKNCTLWVKPRAIEQAIDSDRPNFQVCLLGNPSDGKDSQAQARSARHALRNSPHTVIDCDFDLYVQPFAKDPTYQRMQRMFSEGLDWESAGFFDWMLERIAVRGSFDGCKTEQDVEERYARLEVLVKHLKSGGQLHSPANSRMGRYGSIDGVVVAVGRHGEVIFCGRGKHRLSIAKCLDLQRIPVCVCAVHLDAVNTGAWHELLRNGVVERKPSDSELVWA